MYLQKAYEDFNAIYGDEQFCSFIYFARNFSTGKTFFCDEWDPWMNGIIPSRDFPMYARILLDERKYQALPMRKEGDAYTCEPLSRLVDALRIALKDKDIVRSLRYTGMSMRLFEPLNYDRALEELLRCLEMHLATDTPAIPFEASARVFLKHADFSPGRAFFYSDKLLQCVYDLGLFFLDETGREAACLYFHNDQ